MTALPESRVSWRLVGNERAMASLEPAVLSGEPAHAYLFTGPANVGKATAALEFAAALNCESDARPCGFCRNCRDTLEPDRQHPDVEVIAPGGLCDESEHANHSESRDIRICQVRRLERVLSLTPFRGGRRIAILDNADRLNQDASNAFLKTLEEPPAATVLILVTDREEQLLETVLSRCRRVSFTRVERSQVEATLRDRGIDEARVEAIAGLANGRPGWALTAAENDDLLNEREAFIGSAVDVAHATRSGRFAWAKGADERGTAMRERYMREIEIWEQWWRDVLALSAAETSAVAAGIINADKRDLLEKEARLYTPAAIVRFLRAVQKTREYLQANVDAQLALENLVLILPEPRTGAGSR